MKNVSNYSLDVLHIMKRWFSAYMENPAITFNNEGVNCYLDSCYAHNEASIFTLFTLPIVYLEGTVVGYFNQCLMSDNDMTDITYREL